MRARSIVCGVDFSTASARALRQAAAIARQSRSRLLVLFVEDPLLAAAARAAHDRRGSKSAGEAALKRFISKSLGRSPAPRRMLAAVAFGRPAAGILKAAKRIHADLIVIGTRGLGRAARLLLGSTAGDTLRQARLPVLAVPS